MKQAFLKLLSDEFRTYYDLPLGERHKREQKRQYINGLMVASRLFGVSFEELDKVAKQSHSQHASAPGNTRQYSPAELDYLDIPAFIRNQHKVSSDKAQ